MKKYLLPILFLFIVNKVSAQAYIPLPMDSAYWRISFNSYQMGNTLCDVEYLEYTDGDTIIGIKKFKKVRRSNSQVNYSYTLGPECTGNPDSYAGAIRQDTAMKKIYIIPADSVNELILYDFTQNVGDTVNSFLEANGNIDTISSIDSILINGIYHRQLNFRWGYFSLIEGIGSNRGLLSPFSDLDNIWNLLCTSDKSNIIYPDSASSCSMILRVEENSIDNIYQLYPNPTIGKITVEIKNQKIRGTKLKILDISGRELKNILTDVGENKIQIDISDLHAGFYFLEILSGNRRVMKKIIRD